MLSKRHWDIFPDNIKKAEKEKKPKTKKRINLMRLRKKIMGLRGVRNCRQKMN